MFSLLCQLLYSPYSLVGIRQNNLALFSSVASLIFTIPEAIN